MKVVILAGGMGTRISEESTMKPKPMIEIGDRPILWHIMKIYSHFGFNDFIICCGYKGYIIKKYFVNYHMYQSDCTFHINSSEYEVSCNKTEPWKVTLVNTGLHTLTAGRLLKVRDYVGDEPFLLTYGDGVANIDINKAIDFHKEKGRIVTITSTRPAGRFGAIQINNNTDIIENFKEKARKDQAWVNAGFMVMNPDVFSYLGDGNDMLEESPFEKLVKDKEIAAFKHEGFWSPMDTMRDKIYLEKLWDSGQAPWKFW